MNFLLNYPPANPLLRRLFAATIVLIIVLAPFVLLYSNMSQLRTENKRLIAEANELRAENLTLKHNANVLSGNIDVLQKVNSGNIETIRRLTQERSDSKKAIESLSQRAANDELAINMMSDRIKEMLNNPKNDGEVAPILKETIKAVQQERKK
jgi:hypothetical protein